MIIRKEELDAVRRHIVSVIGGEVVKIVDDHLIIILETETADEMKNKFEALRETPGVISASMAYYNEEEFAYEV
ncbi:chaperone NapD [bacterium]|nr:chaperone NapD [bacterium]